MTLSPRKNILEMTRSRGMGFLPPGGTSLHSSFTFSSTLQGRKHQQDALHSFQILQRRSSKIMELAATYMLQCRSNARTLPRSLWLLRRLISTWLLFLTEVINMERGPLERWSCSLAVGALHIQGIHAKISGLREKQQQSVSSR